MELDENDCALIAQVLSVFVLAAMIEYRLYLSRQTYPSRMVQCWFALVIIVGCGAIAGSVTDAIGGGTQSDLGGALWYGALILLVTQTAGYAGLSMLTPNSRYSDQSERGE